jgi:hypothetical protein
MALRTTYSAETWDKIYNAFSEVSFVSYDYESIKQSLIDYTKTYYPEAFNDYIESSEFIMMLEIFAYIAEQLAYRVDMVSHENFITTAQRKQSILNLAKLISYKATRNIPLRGLVKINSISTTERVTDSRGTDLAGLTINWNDPNNSNWKEQFILVMNRILSNRVGQPHKSFQVGDVVMNLYSLRNDTASFRNGVFAFGASAGQDTYPMEVVPADIDANGPFEREPDATSPMSIIYANDGIGDGSDYTGFLCYVKQGVLTKIDLNLESQLPDRVIDFEPQNINHTDVWVQRVENDNVVERWNQVDTINEQNLVFNNDRSSRRKFEIDTRENDQIAVVFGDGDFSDAPVGTFRFWMRQSANRSIVIQKNRVANESMNFSYASSLGNSETCALTFSLTTTLQNGSGTESIEHIRRAAPSTYYSQNRMVNGQDYNTYPLKDPSILRLKGINRTFAGQPKYLDWNDASGSYENIKLFGDDATMRYQMGINTQTTSVSGQALIDNVIEPLLNTSGVINTLLHITATDPALRGVVSSPRRKFIEDNRGNLYFDKSGNPAAVLGNSDGSLKEKTAIQGLIDRHWYGEPLEYVQDPVTGSIMAKILDPDEYPKDDSKIYSANTPRTIDGVNKFPPGDIGSGLQPIAEQDYFALRYNPYLSGIGNGFINIHNTPDLTEDGEVFTIEVQADGLTLDVRSNLRGSFPSGTVNSKYQIRPVSSQIITDFFTVTQGDIKFEPGDAFVLDYNSNTKKFNIRNFDSKQVINLNGWWEIMGFTQLRDYESGILESRRHDLKFTTSDINADIKQHSWVIFIKKIRQQPTNNIIGYEIHNRELKLTIKSPTTKFWYNSADQILDNETKDVVYDRIRILKSNFDSAGNIIKKSQIYDVVGAVKDDNGIIDFNSLEIIPSDLLKEDESGDLIPDRLLQFETFANNSFEYFNLANASYTFNPLLATDREEIAKAASSTWAAGAFVDNNQIYGRRQRMPALNSGDDGLDFMWQHFSPYTNIIDPSATNIHDMFVLTRGYYDSVISYVRGISESAPTAPTPLELRNSYGYLLKNKMLSDTVVLHSGKIRLLFGSLAEPQLRAKFKVVRSQTGTLTNERIKEEIINVINTFFQIDDWDFGDSFYLTKLITLIHQRLPADIASVVLVPVYSTNSFGSLFTVEPGFDEILQSAAELSDIEIVEALTPTTIRQSV